MKTGSCRASAGRSPGGRARRRSPRRSSGCGCTRRGCRRPRRCPSRSGSARRGSPARRRRRPPRSGSRRRPRNGTGRRRGRRDTRRSAPGAASTISTKLASIPQCRGLGVAGCGTGARPHHDRRGLCEPGLPAGLGGSGSAPPPAGFALARRGRAGSASGSGRAGLDPRHRPQVRARRADAAVLGRWGHRPLACVRIRPVRTALSSPWPEVYSWRRTKANPAPTGSGGRVAGRPWKQLSPHAVSASRACGTLRVVAALVLREMGTRFGRSSGGYLWAIAEPLGGILHARRSPSAWRCAGRRWAPASCCSTPPATSPSACSGRCPRRWPVRSAPTGGS